MAMAKNVGISKKSDAMKICIKAEFMHGSRSGSCGTRGSMRAS
jgi:hypothetical protein